MIKYSVRISLQAQQDIDNIFNYINSNYQNNLAAQRFIRNAYQAIATLKYYPEKFIRVDNKMYPNDVVHRVPFLHYSAFYKIDKKNKTVIVIAITHNSRDWRA